MINTDQGAVMKKSLLVLLLAVLHSACSTPTATQVDSNALISFEEIAAEINISHKATRELRETPRPVAANVPTAD
jgi:uncharacterized protein YcfL